jgi:hypothetical protein
MEVSGQLHASTALTRSPDKKPSVPIGKEEGFLSPLEVLL